MHAYAELHFGESGSSGSYVCTAGGHFNSCSHTHTDTDMDTDSIRETVLISLILCYCVVAVNIHTYVNLMNWL